LPVVAPAHAASSVHSQPSQAAPTAAEDLTLASQVRHLVETRDPEKIFLAYRLLADCDEFNRDHDRVVFDSTTLPQKGKPGRVIPLRALTEQEKQQDAKRCGPMTERDRQSRLEYLAIAVRAGVPGSAVAFLLEGPFGDKTALKTRPGDPLVLEWKALAQAQMIAAAESGTDEGAVHYIAGEVWTGTAVFERNLRLAYRYNIAVGLLQRDIMGPDVGLAKAFAEDGEIMTSLAKDFSPAERAAELAAAHQIVKNYRDRRRAN